MSLSLSYDLYDKIARHLQSCYPNEGAGLLLGHAEAGPSDLNRTVCAILPFANRSPEAEQFHRYQITARDMLEGEIEAERRGLEVIGVFHSHPDDTPRASAYDREHALPWFAYLIASVQRGRLAEARVWVLAHDRSQFHQVPLTVESVVMERS